MDAEDVFAEIVPLFPLAEAGDDAHPVLPAPRETWCAHFKTRLDRDARRVFCRECGREVDAFTVLDRLAAEPQRFIAAREEAKRQAERAHDRLEDVLRRERNAKARLRRAEPPGPRAPGGRVFSA